MRGIHTLIDEGVLAIKGATEASFRLGGGLRSFSQVTGFAVSTLSKYASVNRVREDDREYLEYGDNIIRIDIAIAADRRAGSPIIIGEAARQLGFRLVTLQDELRGGEKLSERDAHIILKEAMDVSGLLIAAFEDGKIDALERKQLRKELRELIRAAEQILEKLGEE